MVSRLDQLPVLVLPTENHLIHVTCVSNKATEDDLRRFFTFCGFVRSVDLQHDEKTSKQQAFINFWDENAVDTALLLNGALLHDSPLLVARPQFLPSHKQETFPSINTNEICSERKCLKSPRRLLRRLRGMSSFSMWMKPPSRCCAVDFRRNTAYCRGSPLLATFWRKTQPYRLKPGTVICFFEVQPSMEVELVVPLRPPRYTPVE